MNILVFDNYTQNQYPLKKEIFDYVLKNESFYENKVKCKDCEGIEDDCYTCTSCWSCGGNCEFKVSDLLIDLVQIRSGKNNYCMTESYIMELLNDAEDFDITLLYEDFNRIVLRTLFDEGDLYNEVFSLNLGSILKYLKESDNKE